MRNKENGINDIQRQAIRNGQASHYLGALTREPTSDYHGISSKASKFTNRLNTRTWKPHQSNIVAARLSIVDHFDILLKYVARKLPRTAFSTAQTFPMLVKVMCDGRTVPCRSKFYLMCLPSSTRGRRQDAARDSRLCDDREVAEVKSLRELTMVSSCDDLTVVIA